MAETRLWAYCDYGSEDAALAYDDLEMLRSELDVQLDGEIVIFADLGLWDGRHRAVGNLKSRNIKDIFSSEYEPIWFIDDGEVRCEEVHHDGVNKLVYRKVTDEDMLDSLCCRYVSHEDLSREDFDSCTCSIAEDVKEAMCL